MIKGKHKRYLVYGGRVTVHGRAFYLCYYGAGHYGRILDYFTSRDPPDIHISLRVI